MGKQFTLATKSKVWWPVEVIRATDGGKTETFRFRVQVEKLSAGDIEAIREGSGDDLQIIRRHIHDWDEVFGEDGEKIAFDEDTLDTALDDLDVRDALRAAVMEVSYGRGARKNSKK